MSSKYTRAVESDSPTSTLSMSLSKCPRCIAKSKRHNCEPPESISCREDSLFFISLINFHLPISTFQVLIEKYFALESASSAPSTRGSGYESMCVISLT